MILGTLGPEGNNHALIAWRYLKRRAPQGGQCVFFDTFEMAFDALLAGELTHVLQCTAHFSHADCVGRYMHRAFPVDAFIAGSKPLALLVRRDTPEPEHVALQPATRYYTDLSAFKTIIEAPTTVDVANGLMEGHYQAGICAEEALAKAPDTLQLMRSLGPAIDTWVIYTTASLDKNSPLHL
ncbi:hypothetical protein [Vreelandella nanhaiensis]|uniref:Uncharacterized protein n=1 Tax=Vreelandella nanhaiensis TaxID=1258546 RepID=A0A3S0W1G3_9GAMM|nr:hypothetical protein [Halomonas nanhaiensis]RUR29003.1 hypothetical protein ELY38_15605 [Halomonas nanhaiensis]